MTRKLVCVVLLTMVLASCATAQRGALISARKAMVKKDYQECLYHLGGAESLGDYSAAINAQILFERGVCLEGLGRGAEAKTLFQHLIEKYPDSAWSAQAKGRLEGGARS